MTPQFGAYVRSIEQREAIQTVEGGSFQSSWVIVTAETSNGESVRFMDRADAFVVGEHVLVTIERDGS